MQNIQTTMPTLPPVRTLKDLAEAKVYMEKMGPLWPPLLALITEASWVAARKERERRKEKIKR